MKISPLGSAIGSVSTEGPAHSPDKMARAKAIAMGQEPQQIVSDPQVERAQNTLKKIKMQTQVSTNRPENLTEPVIEAQVEPNAVPQGTEEVTKSDIVEQAPVAEETQPLSPQFAALAKAKRALQVERAELAKMKAELEQKAQGNLEEYVSKADLKANPLKIFETGVTYDQLTEAILNNPNAGSSEIAALKAEIQALKEGLDTKFNERDQLSEKQVLAQMLRDTESFTAD